MKVYIWGVGANGRKVLNTIDRSRNQILGFIDNDPDKQGKEFEQVQIISSKDILGDHDYIVISVENYEAVLYQLKLEQYNDFNKIILFYNESYLENEAYIDILNSEKWRICILENKVKNLEKILSNRINNLGYEIIDNWKNEKYWHPNMGKTEDAVKKIVSEGYSIIRFGDGEFEIMAGKERPVFQKYDAKLAARLQEVIQSNEENILLAIANNYGELEAYTDKVADGIREYMKDEVRSFHREMLSETKVYYDAYMFKCYMPYKDKTGTKNRVNLIKTIWDKRDIVIIEGDKTRTGQGNDLFDNAKSIKRILAPTKGAFDVYEKILEASLKIEKSALVLIVLGPAGKVLAYDLIRAGFQVVDIGQIDMDYEWFKAGLGEKIPIPNKYVSQLPPTQVQDIDDIEYSQQIIIKIESI